MLKKLLKNVKGYWPTTIATAISVVFEVLIEVLIPILMAQIVNVGLLDTDVYTLNIKLGSLSFDIFSLANRQQFIWAVGGLMCAMALVSLVFGALSGRLCAIASTGFARNTRRELFYKIEDFSFLNMDRFNTASLVTRLTTDVTNVQMSFMMIIRTLVRAPVMLVCAILMAFSIDKSLAWIFLAVLPFLGGLLVIVGKLTFPRFNKMLKKYDDLNESTQENLIGIRVVKAFVRQDHETKKFKDVSSAAQKLQFDAEKLLVVAMPAMQFSMYACMVAIAYFGGRNIIGGKMAAGDLMAFISYVVQILMSLMLIGFVLVMIIMSRASATRIVAVFDEKIDITNEGIEGDPELQDGSVVFDNVDFSYSKDKNHLTLADINLEIKSGEKIGIIGGTGSGKSSLVHLIPRLYDVVGGSLRVGGRDVREYRIETLREEVAMVLQKNVLFSGTIKENLKWGDDYATDEEIIEACKASHAHDFVTDFPQGYDTDLGQGGVNVSGGQKQRLTIARALLKKPKIMIMDDSTSAVDTNTDAKIRKALRERFNDVTVIIIAQRITSVCDLDRIVVMNDGKIEAIGTHDELLESNTIYREIYSSQQKEVA